MSNELRVGVIGCGGMAQQHMEIIKDLPRLKFAAASDTFAGNLDKVVQKYGVKGFLDGHEMIRSGLIDAVFIGTPHYFHPPYAIAGFESGLHVLTEKPVAVMASAAAAVNAVHAQHPKLKYGAMFQMRTIPIWQEVRRIVKDGRLGKLHRAHWTITNWFRKQAYYNSSAWRATWAGEGGGVLANQCPHNLDLWCWIFGPPKRVTATVNIGRYHNIEVEDDVVAQLEYPGGVNGQFITSTGEFPGTNFFEVAGDRGKLTIVGKTIELIQTDVSIADFSNNTPGAWGAPTTTKHTIEPPDGGSHKLIWENFVAACLDDKPLLASATEGLAPVELANAMILAGLRHKAVDLPLNHAEFDDLLRELIAKSKKSTSMPPGLDGALTGGAKAKAAV